MGLPRTLKNFNVFADGESWMGEVSEVQLPKLTKKLEEYRGAGMPGPADIDLGLEKLEMEMTCGGLMKTALTQFGVTTASGVLLRFAGAYERDDTGDIDAVEVVTRGRHKEIDMGSAKMGEKSDFKISSSLTYYKLSINNATVIEIDTINMVYIVDGTDILAKQRAAIGL